MDQHRGMRRDRCSRCQAKVTVTYRPDVTSDQRVWVRVERRLPGQVRRFDFWVQLAVKPGETTSRDISRFLFSAEPDHELTLAEAVVGVPGLIGESVRQIIEGLGKLSGDCPDCGQRLGLVADLFAALVVMLVTQLVAPLLAFLECVAVIGALLPGGDIDQAATLLIRHWTRDIFNHWLGPYLERWTSIISVYSMGGLLTVIEEIRLQQRPDEGIPATRQRVTDAHTPVVLASKEYQDRFRTTEGHGRPEPLSGPFQSSAADRPPDRPQERPQGGFDHLELGFEP